MRASLKVFPSTYEKSLDIPQMSSSDPNTEKILTNTPFASTDVQRKITQICNMLSRDKYALKVAEHSFRAPMPRLSLLLNWLSTSAQNWQDISLKYRLSYFGDFFELCEASMATRLALNRLERLDCLFAENPVVRFSPSFVLNKT